MSEIKVDTVAEKTSANGVTVDGLNIKDSKLVTANSVVETNLTDNIVTLAKMASGTDGNIISYDASGNPVAIATGSDGQVLTSTGAGSAPAFEAIPAGGKIGQVIYQSTVFDSAHSSDTQVANLSITPSSSSSKILIMSTIVAQLDSDEYGGVDIYRGTLASGSKVFDAGDVFFHNAGSAVRCHYTFSYIDSPSTTSAQSYSIVISPQASGTVRYGCGASNMLQLWEILP